MLRRAYDRVMDLAASRHAPSWLAAVAFAESSFFPIPPDAMLAPMILARPGRAYVYAGVCTAGSVIGGILGYAIGYFLAPLALKLLALLGHADGLQTFRAWYAQNGFVLILLKGLTPVPYKLVTITAGLAAYSFALFVLASVITRGARFFLVAALFKYFGPPIRVFIERRLTLVTSVIAVLTVLVLVALHTLG